MTLTQADEDYLKQTLKRLSDRPLEPGDPLYVPIYDQPGVEDPMAKIALLIETAEVESIQLFSGFKGSGKTTELFRLRSMLEKKGHFVLYADALDYLDVGAPVDENTVLLAVAGAFSEALERKLGENLPRENFWQRLNNFLAKTKVEVPEASLQLGPSAGVKVALKTSPTFREKLRAFLSARPGELKAEVNKFIEDAVKHIRKQVETEDAPIVFLFDSFDQVRGTLLNEREVIASVAQLFGSHFDLLKLPYVHAVYTVHPWLSFIHPGAFDVVTLPSIRQWENDPARTRYDPGCDVLRQVVNKRLQAEGMKRLFGGDDTATHPLADQLIDMCGGDFRDLLRLFRELITLVLTWTRSLPAGQEVVQRAIENVRDQYLPLAEDEIVWLAEIEKERSANLPSKDPEVVSRFTRLVDSHLVLFLGNGGHWYDVHPIVRDHVKEMAARLKQQREPPRERSG